MVEDYQNRLTAQEDTISAIRQTEENATNAIATLEQEKELLIQSNEKMSREVARLMSVDIELQSSKKEVEKCQFELRKAEEELQTKEFMVSNTIMLNPLFVPAWYHLSTYSTYVFYSALYYT